MSAYVLDELITADARTIIDTIPDRSVDLIFTDPVYANIDDYVWLASHARRICKPNAAILLWCSNVKQYDVHFAIGETLPFVMPLSYVKVAKTYRLWGYKCYCWATPCLWYQLGDHDHGWLIDTVIDEYTVVLNQDAPPPQAHKWYKGAAAYTRWLRALCPAGGTVYDPFAGSGSLEVECNKYGRHWYASERVPSTAAGARARIGAQTMAMFES